MRGRGETGFFMKDDPNDRVMADKVVAGGFPDMIMARRGWGADLI